MKTRLLFLLILFLPLFAHASPRVNNGGGVWVCTQNSETSWVQAADFFELPASQRNREDFGSASVDEIFAKKLHDIENQLPELHQLLMKWPVDFKKVTQFVNFSLTSTEDMDFQTRPQPSDCPEGAASYEQLAVYLYNDTLLISKPLWDSEKMKNADRAAILFHEWIYKALREDRDEQNSARTRKIVALIFSAQDPGSVEKEVSSELNTSSHGQLDNELATFPVAPRCEALVNGVVVGSWQAHGGSFGEKGEFRAGGFRFSVETSAQDGVPESMSVLAEKTGWSTVLEAPLARATYLRLKRSQLHFRTGGAQPSDVLFWCWNQI